jgi:hypothetical protein
MGAPTPERNAPEEAGPMIDLSKAQKGRDPRDFCGRPSAFIVCDARGLESWVCAAHAERPRWVLRTPFADWFKARKLEPPAPELYACPELLGTEN